jgi:hypothetical protein
MHVALQLDPTHNSTVVYAMDEMLPVMKTVSWPKEGLDIETHGSVVGDQRLSTT